MSLTEEMHGSMKADIRYWHKRLPYLADPNLIPTWRTLETGSLSAGLMHNAMQAKGIKANLDDIRAAKNHAAAVPRRSELVRVGHRFLEGLAPGLAREAVFERSHIFGLRLCLPDIGPELRLAYDDQPEKDDVSIAMYPQPAVHGYIFVLGNNGSHGTGKYLIGHSGSDDWRPWTWMGTPYLRDWIFEKIPAPQL
ncbi:MAG: hypothetical protein JWN50_555 [Parcubacteria group bacterium]|nr:hypothetical protein [Parcubacteria group bacterium]